MNDIKLGDLVTDKITHVKGQVTAVATYLYGENAYLFTYTNKAGTICNERFSPDRLEVMY